MTAPGPVPALPDSERRTSYAITASIGPLNVGFAIYGDSTDYLDWVEVYVNNVATTSFTLTSPSGALSAIARPIVDAQITFNSAQTGTVQIVGARRPRRVAQFTENQGVAARDENQALTDIVAMQREAWDLRSRLIRGMPGDSFPALLPSARAGTLVGFDGSGNLILYATTTVATPPVSLSNGAIFDTRGLAALATIAVTTTFIQTAGFSAVGDLGAATYIKAGATSPGGFQSADGQWWALTGNPVNVRQFGASPSASAAANRAAFQAASDYCDLVFGGTVWIPSGTYQIDAAILPAARTIFRGVGNGTNVASTSGTAHVFDLQHGNCQILDMQITNASGAPRTAGAGIKANAAGSGFTINRVDAFGMYDGVEIDSSVGWTVANSNFTSTVHDGIYIHGASDIMQVFNVVVTSPSALTGHAGIELSGPGDLTVSGDCQFVGILYGILINPTTLDTSSCRISQVLCDHNFYGLWINPVGAAASVSRCTFSQCDFTSAFGEGVRLETGGGSRIDDMSFDQCTMTFNGSDGLRIVDTGVTNTTVVNSLLAGNTANGLDLAAGVTRVKAIGNRLGSAGSAGPNAQFGVMIGVGAGDYITVIHNNLLGNTGGTISNGAAGIHNVVTPNDIP